MSFNLTILWWKSSKLWHELSFLNNNVFTKLDLYDKGIKLSKLVKTPLDVYYYLL